MTDPWDDAGRSQAGFVVTGAGLRVPVAAPTALGGWPATPGPATAATRAAGAPAAFRGVGPKGYQRSDAHDAFYAAKSAQAGFAEILSKRLRPQGVRVISLYPPDFDNANPLSEEWETTPRGAKDALTAQSLVECILFAVAQPRDCFIKAFHFEQV